jgi:penicillin-binding protein 2
MEPEKKRAIILTICAIVFILLGTRLAYLQLFSADELRGMSDKNSIKTITITPPRGLMYDRNGKVLVDNKPSYTVTITPSQFDTNNLAEMSSLLDIPPERIMQALKEVKGTNRFNPAKIKRDVEFRVVAHIAENHDRLKGIDYQIDAIRSYPDGIIGSHAFGYASEISEKALKKQESDYYKQGDVVGSTGLEKNYEKDLRGVKGYKFITVDVNGREIGPLNEGNSDIPPVNGQDLMLGMDKDLQLYAEQLMEGKEGALVALDPRNGEILCFVSKPDFDLSLFTGKTDPKVYASLIANPDKPMFNRVTQTRYPPGSTWKMMMSMAALDSGIITPTSTVNCPGAFVYGGRAYEDHGSYGNINVVRALEVSSNVFYYKMGLALGIDNFEKYCKMFGFGQKTGIDIPQEYSGLLPTRKYYDKVFGKDRWPNGVLVNLGIGQGELGVTPMQMVAYTAAIAMNGLYCQPHFVSKIKNTVTNTFEDVKFEQRRIDMPQKYYESVNRGMYLVVNGAGTAKSVKSDDFELCGKTGTAQNSTGKNHSWFVGYAPYGDPRIAICVLGEKEGYGATFAAPTAAKIMVKYLGGPDYDPEGKIKTVSDGVSD